MSGNITNLPLDIWDEALQIEAAIGEYLLPHRPGWYVQSSTLPVMLPDKQYYQKINGAMVEITNVRAIRSSIYDAGGNIVFPYPPAGRVIFHDHPMVPTIGLYIIKEYVDAVVANNLRWVRNKMSFSDRLKRYFRPQIDQPDMIVKHNEDETSRVIGPWEGTSMESLVARYGAGIEIAREEKISYYCEEEIRSILIGIRDALAAFMGVDDHWRIYETELKNRTLFVKRLGDYRIWEWQKLHEELRGEDLYLRRINDAGVFEYVRYERRIGG